MIKIGILKNFLNSFKQRFVVYTGFSRAHSSPFNKNLYEQETVRAVIDCIATHAAKAEAMHVVVDDKGRIKEIKRNSEFVRLLNEQPNAIMSGFDLKYKVVTQLETHTTALCFVKWGKDLKPEYFIPIPYNSFEFIPVSDGKYAVAFDYEGEKYNVYLHDMVVLRKFFNNYEVAGDGNDPIYSCLDMAKAANEGFIQALQVSNKVRGIHKQTKAMLSPEDVQKNTQKFVDSFNEAANKGGIIGLDASSEYIPIDNVSTWAANAAQMKDIRNNILAYWRTNESILTSNYNDTQWQAFYESVIEPILIKMGQAFTNVCFTPDERKEGNRIYFATDTLLHMSVQAKTTLLATAKELGLFTKNEFRAMFGYHPVEGGDEFQVSLNYVKGSDQSIYQIGKEDDDGEITEQTP